MMKGASHRLFDRDLSEPLKFRFLNLYMMELQGKSNQTRRREELKKLRESTGMNQKEFCEYFEIPYMTGTDWELGNRRVPQYLLRLMAYKIEIEKLANKKKENDQEDEAT